MKIVELLKRIKYQVFLINMFKLKVFLKDIGMCGRQKKSIKSYENKFKNKRCFIVATGPSLLISDLEKLKDEYSFGMNSICLAFEKTEWRPTFYGIQDENVYEKIKDSIIGSNLENVFISSDIARKNEVKKDWNIFDLNLHYHSMQSLYNQNYFCKFSKNCYRQIYDGYTITYSLIQLAIYMGFNKIYLLGADCNYEKDKQNHFIEYGLVDPELELARTRMLVSYKEAKKYADANGIKIFNATRGGMLEEFERVDLDEVLGSDINYEKIK